MKLPSTTSPLSLSRKIATGTRSICQARRYYYAMASEQKHPKYGHLPLSTSGPLECAITGTVVLNHPYFNKGSAFTKEERHDFNLTGLLPQAIQTLEQQAKRAYQQYSLCGDDLAKNTFMTSMKEQNGVLFYKVRKPFTSMICGWGQHS